MRATIEVRCEKCNNQAPINKAKSTPNWIIHDTSKPCICGGQYKSTVTYK